MFVMPLNCESDFAGQRCLGGGGRLFEGGVGQSASTGAPKDEPV